jgi:hypothetical protein
MAIRWIYREACARAGYLVRAVLEQTGSVMPRQSELPTVVPVPVSAVSILRSHAGAIYPVDALALSTGFVSFAAELAISRPDIAMVNKLVTAVKF